MYQLCEAMWGVKMRILLILILPVTLIGHLILTLPVTIVLLIPILPGTLRIPLTLTLPVTTIDTLIVKIIVFVFSFLL